MPPNLKSFHDTTSACSIGPSLAPEAVTVEPMWSGGAAVITALGGYVPCQIINTAQKSPRWLAGDFWLLVNGVDGRANLFRRPDGDGYGIRPGVAQRVGNGGGNAMNPVFQLIGR